MKLKVCPAANREVCCLFEVTKLRFGFARFHSRTIDSLLSTVHFALASKFLSLLVYFSWVIFGEGGRRGGLSLFAFFVLFCLVNTGER